MCKKYHFIGIGGIGMSGLARLLLQQRMTVTGSDLASQGIVKSLIEEGAIIYQGHAATNVPPDATVVYSTDIKPHNPEYQAAIAMQCPLMHRSDLLAHLIKQQDSLGVTGTHGKTTTSSLLATVLVEGGLDPSFAIGGILSAFQVNGRSGKGKHFIFEADESDRSFLKYSPMGAIITNIDHDHLEYYQGNFALLLDSFKQFMSQVQSKEYLFWCRDDLPLASLNFPGQTYGFHPNSDWQIVAIRQEGFRMSFDLEHNGQRYSQIELALVGRHNVLNGAAVFGLAHTLGIAEERVRYSLKNFKGVLRRCQNKGQVNDIVFIDDYAHHPTEIETTLKSIKQAIGSKRLVAVFQPHRYTRTQACLGKYASIFEHVDELFITDIYGGGEAPIPNLSSVLIQKEIQEHTAVHSQLISRSELSQFLARFVQPNDVVVTLGAGDITHVADETLSLLKK